MASVTTPTPKPTGAELEEALDDGITRLRVNGEDRELSIDPDTPLLWALRDKLRLQARNTAAASPNAVPAQ